jgi:type IV fimbrial biogenesis protein FimT
MLDEKAGRHMLMRRGFTLIELLVVIAVAAVGMTLAAPGAMQMIAKRKVQNAAQSILDGLSQARTEAVRRNAAVQFALRSDGIGWTVTQVSSGDTLRSYRSGDWGSLQLTSAGAVNSVTFLPTGLLQGGTQLSQLDLSSTASAAAQRRINVFGGGLIRMCDPTVASTDDPRRC